jgi:hypothetical protein
MKPPALTEVFEGLVGGLKFDPDLFGHNSVLNHKCP